MNHFIQTYDFVQGLEDLKKKKKNICLNKEYIKF